MEPEAENEAEKEEKMSCCDHNTNTHTHRHTHPHPHHVPDAVLLEKLPDVWAVVQVVHLPESRQVRTVRHHDTRRPARVGVEKRTACVWRVCGVCVVCVWCWGVWRCVRGRRGGEVGSSKV